MSVKETNLNDPVTFYQEYILEQSNAKRYFNKYVAGITLTNDSAGDTKIHAWYSNQVGSVLNSEWGTVCKVPSVENSWHKECGG